VSRRAALRLPLLALPARAADPAEQVAVLLAALDALSAQASLPDAELAARFDALADRHFDRAAMLGAALGNARRGIGDADWARLQAAFGAHLARGFVLGVRRQGASASRVMGSRPLSGGGRMGRAARPRHRHGVPGRLAAAGPDRRRERRLPFRAARCRVRGAEHHDDGG
jgi:hypothetical protein